MEVTQTLSTPNKIIHRHPGWRHTYMHTHILIKLPPYPTTNLQEIQRKEVHISYIVGSQSAKSRPWVTTVPTNS